MQNKEILKLMLGYRKFREKYFTQENSVYSKLAVGQTPKTLIIGCCDSRVDPAILSSASPGELFVVRNVANLVPPCEASIGYHGVSAAIEFAVVFLKVENILVLGHRQCGGIRALMSDTSSGGSHFINQWVNIAQRAKDLVLKKHPRAPEGSPEFEQLCRHCEMESIIVSIENLKTFPFIQDSIKSGHLSLHGAYFDIESGTMFELDQSQNQFRALQI